MDTVDKDENVQSSEAIDINSPSKLLSICMFGRDDDYMLDFRYRITTTINHLARSIKNLGQQDKVEILVTDWGSHVPMAQTLELSPEAAEVCRFIYVPPEVIRATQEDKDHFHTSRAHNVAIRRACGKYILSYAADTFIQEHSLAQMLRLLSGEIHLPIEVERTFFMIPRFDVPWQFLERRPNLEEWDRYLLLLAKNTPLEPTCYMFFGGAGALMMYHKLWYESRGLDESFSAWGVFDFDLGMRVSQYYSFLSLSCIGVFLYHMGHNLQGSRAASVLNANPIFFNPTIEVNNEDWGLGNYELEIQIPKKIGVSAQVESISKSLEPLTIEPWSQGFAEIVSELTNNNLLKSVMRVIWSYLDRGWVLDREEINTLFFLSWYSRHHFPHRFLEFIIGRTSGSGAVAAACPSVEIYKISHWEGHPDDSPIALVNMLNTLQFGGYVRFVNGEICTAIKRLKDSFIGHFGFDLMLVGGIKFGEELDNQVCDLLSCLSPGGALILSYTSPNDFIRIWRKIQHNYSQYTYFQCEDQKTGMVLAAKLRDYNHDQAPQIGNICFESRWRTLLKLSTRFKIIRRILWRVYRIYKKI